MLEQEFWAILLTTMNHLNSTAKHLDVSTHLAESLENLLPFHNEESKKFYLRYYGPNVSTPQLLGIELS
ncbi:unnamed protein product [Calypogeia fissa]